METGVVNVRIVLALCLLHSVYTFHKNNVGTSDAGTYYCALAACGEIVFGKGTKLDVTGHYILLPTSLFGNYLIKKITHNTCDNIEVTCEYELYWEYIWYLTTNIECHMTLRECNGK